MLGAIAENPAHPFRCVCLALENDLFTCNHSCYPYSTYRSYAIISWGSACKTNLSKVITKQNKCVRSIFFAYSRENAAPYYNFLGMLKFLYLFIKF